MVAALTLLLLALPVVVLPGVAEMALAMAEQLAMVVEGTRLQKATYLGS